MKQFRDTNYWITEDGKVFRYFPERQYPKGSKQADGSYSYYETKPEEYKEIKLQNHNKGYYMVSIYINPKKGRHTLVHHLVAECYLGFRPDGMVIDHIDNNPKNNHYTNLQYVNQQDNLLKNPPYWKTITF